MIVGLFVCLSVCLLEPPYFLWNYHNLGYIEALLYDYVLELSECWSVCLFVGMFVVDYVLELSECFLFEF